jgi:acetyl-CoA carboxylase biotin carboxylase subunit
MHPGLGFLAENADFAATVEEHGFIFIGPRPSTPLMGNKVAAKETVSRLGIATVLASAGRARPRKAEAAARTIGYPVLIKPLPVAAAAA